MEPHLYQWLENSRCRASGALHSPGAAFHPWPVPGHHLRGSSPKLKVTTRDGVMSVSPVPGAQWQGRPRLSLRLSSQADPHPAALRSGPSVPCLLALLGGLAGHLLQPPPRQQERDGMRIRRGQETVRPFML